MGGYMRHYKGQDYVNKRISEAKQGSIKPAGWLIIIGGIILAIGFSGFIICILLFILSISSSMGSSRITPFEDITSKIPLVITFFAMAFIGNIIYFIGVNLLGLNPGRTNLLEILKRIKGDDINILEAGKKGEEEVLLTLQGLDESWILFSGVVTDGMLGDIDYVLIGKPGVYAIEVKNWSGQIFYEEDQNLWYRIKRNENNREIIKNPAEQIIQTSKILETVIGVKTIPILVFTNINSTLSGDHPVVQMMQIPKLKQYILMQQPTIDENKVNELAKILSYKLIL
jgi:hypothetical protein